MLDILLTLTTPAPSDMVDYPDSGPGPTLLQLGDENIGYFGTLSQSELLTAPQLRTAVNLTAGVANTWTGVWIKMFSRGKVLFFPDAGLNNNISWANLYTLGITSGRDSVDAAETSTPTIQRKVITHGTDQFVVRLFHSAPSYVPAILQTISMSMADARLYYSEWGEIICRISRSPANGWTGPRWNLFDGSSLMGVVGTIPGDNLWCWASPDSMGSFQTNYQHIMNNGFINGVRSNRTIYQWYPVLELIRA